MSIKDIQQALHDQGFDPKGIDGIAGGGTYAAVAEFQKAHGLKADGVLRWETLNALLVGFPWAPTLPARALQIMSLMVGVKEEIGPNDGVMVRAFQRATGGNVGDSWCMDLVVWSYDQAADGLQISNTLIRTGGVMDQYHRSRSQVIPSAEYDDPHPGDIGIIDLGGGHGHTYMVVKPGGAGVVDSVEGNTNTDGSANGNGAYFRQRMISHTKAFIRVA